MRRRGKYIGGLVVIAAAFAAFAAPGSAAAFGPVASFGSEGAAAGQLSAPSGIAVGPGGNVYVADSANNRVSVFSPAGDFLFAFGAGVGPGGGATCTSVSGCGRGSGGGAAGALAGPEGIAISGAGDVYVSEPANDRVSVFSAQGTFIFAFGYGVNPSSSEPNRCTAASGCQKGGNERPALLPEGFTTLGPEGALGGPSGIAIDPAGLVFVAENFNNRVSVFGPVGEFKYMFGTEVEGQPPFEGTTCSENCEMGTAYYGAGSLSGPTGLVLSPAGDLIVAEGGNAEAAEKELESHRVDVFTPGGEFIRGFGHGVSKAGGDVCDAQTECQAGSGSGAGSLPEPQSIAAAATGSIYVGDTTLERVSQFDAAGNFVRAFGAGVLTGADSFQECTAASGCLPGHQSTVLGATSHPFGLAEACRGGLFVSESTNGVDRVERFGEADSFTPPCPIQPAPIAARVVPSNLFTLGRLHRDRHRGTATLVVAVPSPGQLTLNGRGIHRASAAAAPGIVTLPLRLLGKPRHRLLAAGHRTVVAHIHFTPTGGTTRTESRPATLVKKPRAQRKRR